MPFSKAKMFESANRGVSGSWHDVVTRRPKEILKRLLDRRPPYFRTREEVERELELPVLAVYSPRRDR